ncbi:MAG: Dethiobiotin synthetase [Phormidesmis sp. RL_2_1]|nr:Dethiobiotin synthetase [Phormidesmis sp. RL_2_1]
MDFKTACQLIAEQTLPKYETHDTFLARLRQGQPPVPGQVTSLLLALQAVYDALQSASTLDRELAQALFLIAYESRNLFESARAAGVAWPPLLDEDLTRIAIATYKIFAHEPGEPTNS